MLPQSAELNALSPPSVSTVQSSLSLPLNRSPIRASEASTITCFVTSIVDLALLNPYWLSERAPLF